MDFELTNAEKEYRKELREFLDKEVNEGVIAETESLKGPGPYSKELVRRLGSKSLLTPSWPEKYGGRGLSYVCDTIFTDELVYHRGPFPLDGVELGRCLMVAGSEYLKDKFLLGIAKGEIDIALGFTEPDSGSDLASLQFRAVEDGNEFVLNGQKIYNTEAHTCDYHWVLTRTNPDPTVKHKGLSIFIVDLKSPGITIRPLITMSGLRTNEVFYEDVRVPKENMVGEKDNGWRTSQAALREGGPGFTAGYRHRFQAVINYLTKERPDILRKNPWAVEELARYGVLIHIADLMGYAMAARSDQKMPASYQSPIGGLMANTGRKAFFNTITRLLGPYGQLAEGSEDIQMNGMIAREYLDGPRWTIIHGTSEIQRILISRGLGLPRK
jgi:3-oxocholest-4-en-26-oyl-CoA dehydrogenase alpha subunit